MRCEKRCRLVQYIFNGFDNWFVIHRNADADDSESLLPDMREVEGEHVTSGNENSPRLEHIRVIS